MCENFVKFGPVTPELNVNVDVWYDTAKNGVGVFGIISPDLLDRLLQSLHHMKAHYVQIMDL